MVNKEKTISIFILIFIILSLFFILTKYLNYSFIISDDTDTCLCDSIKSIFSPSANGIYIASLFDKLFGTIIPELLNMHPSDFKSGYFSQIEAVFIISFILILNGLLIKKINYLYNLSFIFTTLILFKFVQQQPYMLFVYDGFFRMLLPSFLFVSLFFVLITNINRKFVKNIAMCILVFLCCISNEMICISTFFGFLMFLFLNVFTCPGKFKNLFSPKNINILIGAIFSCLGFFLLYKSGAFFRKTGTEILNYEYFTEIVKLIPVYLPYYIKYVFINHIIGYVLLISQIIILKIRYPKDENIIKTIKLIISFLSGILIFFFMLIGLNKTHYSGGFWVVHDDLHVIYNVILCAFNYSLLYHIIKSKFIKYIVCLIFLTALLFLAYNNFHFYKNLENIIISLRELTYKAEKIIRLSNEKNKKSFLNKKILSEMHLWALFHSVEEKEENMFYQNSPYIIFLNQFNKENKFNQGFIYTDEETADKEFRDNGGIFTEDELKDIKFNRLRDKNFLLNN